MPSELNIVGRHTVKSLFGHGFLALSLLFVFCVFPLDLVFRLNSLLISMPPWELAAVSGAVILLYLLAAFLLAALLTLLFVPIVRFGGDMGHRSAVVLINFASSILVLYALLRSFRLWLLTFGYGIPFRTLVVTAILWLVILLVLKGRLDRKTSELLASLQGPLVTVSLVSVLIVCAHAAMPHEVRMDASAATPPASSGGARPNIILITFDALSAKDMSLYGYGLNTTPNIDAFAGECYVYDNAMATSNWTRPTVASLLYGVYPWKHRMFNAGIGNIIPATDSGLSLPAQLKKGGYKTASFVTNWGYATPLTNNTHSYFDVDEAPVHLSAFPTVDIRFRYLMYRAATALCSPLLQKAGEWISEASIGVYNAFDLFLPQDRPPYPPELVFSGISSYLDAAAGTEGFAPFFIWGHVTPPHAPYMTTEEFKNRFLPRDAFATYQSQHTLFGEYSGWEQQEVVDRLRLKYNESVLYADSRFGEFLKHLKEKNYLDNTVVIITSDHGESFSHGYVTHGGDKLYNDVIHIPLLVRLPKQVTGARFSSPVSQVDIYPTILRLAGLKVPDVAEGVDLLSGAQASSRRVYSMNFDGNDIRGPVRKGTVTMMEGSRKYICSVNGKNGEVYDLQPDSNETVNLYDRSQQLVIDSLVETVRKSWVSF